MTARPFLVAMRARKPWVRKRETVLWLLSPFFTASSSKIGRAGGQRGAQECRDTSAKDQAAERVQGENPQPRYPFRRRWRLGSWPSDCAERATARGAGALAVYPFADSPRLILQHVLRSSAVQAARYCLPTPGLEPRRPRRRASGGAISRRAKSKTIGKLTIIAWISTTSTTAPVRSTGRCALGSPTGADKNCPILGTCMTAAAQRPRPHRLFILIYKWLSILLPNSRGC